MPKNTKIVSSVLVLFILALIFVNFIKKPIAPATQQTPVSSPSPTKPPTPEKFTSDICGIELSYPATFDRLDTPSGGVVLTSPDRSSDTVIVTCQKDIPRPPLPPEQIETIAIGPIQAKLYHDASASDGAPIDKFIFYHPTKKLDVYIAGIGAVYDSVIASLTILK